MRRSRALSLAGLLLFPSSALAQGQFPMVFSDIELSDTNTIDWPAGLGGPGGFERAVVGRITGHDEVSAIVTKGGIATLVYRPTHFNALSEISSISFTDVTILEDPDLDDQDGIVCAGSTGLTRFEFDPATQEFDSQPIGGLQWVNASQLSGIDLDGVGGQDLLGLDQTGANALVLHWDEDTGTLNEYSFELVAPGERIRAMDWNNDGTKEIVVYHPTEIAVYPLLGGDPIDSVRLLHSGGALAPMVNPSGPDYLAVTLRSPSNTTDWLYTFNSGGYEGPYPLRFSPPWSTTPAPIGVTHLLAADWNADGVPDLLPAHQSYHQAFLMDNSGTSNSPQFTTADAGVNRIDLSQVPGQPAIENQAVPAFADLDHDPKGTADLLFPLDTMNGLVVQVAAPMMVEDPNISMSPRGGTQNASGTPVWQFFDGLSTYDQQLSSGSLELHLRGIPRELTEFEFIQVVIWSQDDPLSPAEPPETDRVAIYNKLHRIGDDTLSPGNHILPITIPRGGTACGNCQGGGYLWPDRQHLYLLLRFVTAVPWQGNYRVIEGAFPLALGMTLPSNQQEMEHQDSSTNPAYEYLRNTGIENVIIQLIDPPSGGQSTNFVGNAGIGAIVPRNALPPFAIPGVPDSNELTMGDETRYWIP